MVYWFSIENQLQAGINSQLMQAQYPEPFFTSKPNNNVPFAIKKRTNMRSSFYESMQDDNQNIAPPGLKPRHKKYMSCECSPHSTPLTVKKELLLDRNQQMVIPQLRQQKVKFKQKTDCINTTYMRQLKLCRDTMDWVKYNIQLGIYALLDRIKKHFNQELLQKKQFQKIKPQLSAITKYLKQLQKYAKVVPTLALELAPGSSKVVVTKNQKQKVESLRIKYFQKGKSKAAESTQIEHRRFREAVNGLSSAICLLSRRISLEKENQLVKEFFEQSTSNQKQKNRSHGQQIALLYQILQINHRRCSILNDLTDRLTEIEQLKLNIKLSEQQIRQLRSLNLLQDLERVEESRKDGEIHKISENVRIILQDSALFGLSKKQSSLKTKNILKTSALNYQPARDQPKKNVRIVTKDSKSHKASIQLFMDQIDQTLNRGKTGSNKISQRSKSKLSVQFETNHEMKLGFQTNQQPKVHFYEPKIIKKKEATKGKQKKALAFAHEIGQDELALSVKSESKSGKSIVGKKKGIKLPKQGTSVLSSGAGVVSIKSFKSIKSLKSMRSVTSNGSYGSNKVFTRSLKTQRQIKFIQKRSKKISGIRPYRSILFKLTEDFSNGLCEQSELWNFASKLLEETERDSSQKLLVSINNLVIQQSGTRLNQPGPIKQTKQEQIIQATPTINRNNMGRKANLIFPSANNKNVIKKPQNPLFHRKSKKAAAIVQHYDDKSNAIRNFLSLCNQLKSSKNIIENKKEFQQHFERLHQNQLIDESLYQKYRKYFTQKKTILGKQSRTLKLTTEQQQQQANKRSSPYSSLASLRKNICQNRRLSQINKYYYNFEEFKGEQEQIEKTKQHTVIDEEFFKMKLYVDHREICTFPINKKLKHFQGSYLSQDDKLQQKDI